MNTKPSPDHQSSQEIELQAIHRGGGELLPVDGGAGPTGLKTLMKARAAHLKPDLASEGPRLQAPSDTPATGLVPEEQTSEAHTRIPRWPFACLILQHFSSAWTDRTYEFASFLYLVTLFPDSFVPAALLGLLTTGAGLVFSGWVGGLVDNRERLVFVRAAIAVQKVSVAFSYILFIVLFVPLREASRSAWAASDPSSQVTEATSSRWVVYLLLAFIIITSSIAGLASGGLNTSIQRDWVMTIADGSTSNLTLLNTYLRRVDLLCKLLSPLVVSLLTTAASYRSSLYFYICLTGLSTVFEYVWIEVVYKAFPILGREEGERQVRRRAEKEQQNAQGRRSAKQVWEAVQEDARQMGRDWADFARQPVFLSSVAISLAYLSTLSFDGIMLSYLKSQRQLSDPFVAGMRGLSVVMGLLGTVAMPWMERRVGLVRGGAWSLWSEVVCLAPPVVTLFVGLPRVVPPGPGEHWNQGLFFTFISLSRTGLWSFDLFQLQALQEALKDHPRRNRLTSLQLALQSAFDLAKYALVLGWSAPEDYKWTAVVSFGALLLAGGVYTAYLFRMRGHVFHWKRIEDADSVPRATSCSGTKRWQWPSSSVKKRREWGEGVTRRRTDGLGGDDVAASSVPRVQSTS